MHNKRLSEMDRQEIFHEIQTYKEKMRKAEMNGIMNEYDVYANKVVIAESYLINPDDVEIGKIYPLQDGTEDHFKVERLKGVFAWGYRLNSVRFEEGLPLSLLKL
ncbi:MULTISPECIES: YfhH family protein [unclassified Staphylococcus]|uniref:YfhH family protein n=1 Tax=unclassified Staphylococcus TaxID=91994 RepID=UPI0021D2902B|nr:MULTISPECIES: YfhH family protein [unclassified Staphylococcus]UXR68965.1 YfhH family protein [Staphylococcus sp. IVB6246]UXR71023.1 YfhH family protein [Staphylococcus sp. IVB6240]UXR73250.1 YfhH family protein [Staphylococcus sp. IVB6238]UXR75548.1 YfhH family protein [Staphylococcus sp. IVB6233]UXR79749.1 YfhH family protein [Staphylococcus sp. IVB6218]